MGRRHWQYESLSANPLPLIPSMEKVPTPELKPLPSHLCYAYLGDSVTLLVIIANNTIEDEEKKLLEVLKMYKTTIRLTIANIREISPTLCMHKILTKKESKPSVDGPTLKEVMKWLDVEIIYPISDSFLVSPVHVMSTNGGIILEKNESNKLILTRLVTG